MMAVTGSVLADALFRRVVEAEAAALEAADRLEHLDASRDTAADMSAALVALAERLEEWSTNLRLLAALLVRADDAR